MTRKKSETKCPYCEKICAVAGLTSHVRSKHTEKYQEFQDNKAALIEKYKIVEGHPAPVDPPIPEPEVDPTPPPAHDPAPDPEPKDPSKPDPKDQQSGSFLGSIGKALREW